MTQDTVFSIAAIVYKPTDHIEPILLQAARHMQSLGYRLGGVLQHDQACIADDPCAMELEDLFTAERFALSQDLGSGSEACRLDPAALAHASSAVQQAIEQGAQLLLFNKFGAQEAGGEGLRDEMALAVVAGRPILTAVGERFMEEWERFTGGEWTRLNPDLAEVRAWCEQAMSGQ